MGLSIILGGLAVASVVAPAAQLEPHRVVVVQRQTPAPAPTFQLPETAGSGVLPSPIAVRQTVAYPRIAGPEPVQKQSVLPSLDWDDGNAALKMRAAGIHLGWNF
ncbi:hypothetical protein [Erythrobacter sp. SG61-1L]|uniref:hypothetical protein n=1 Tax=Erythrobacter sp. SG61-1L TaxID=1603897 RepID=UPI0006C8FA34|nr:hypothetical protein [Erythrobacter sp. SG61-1L]